jgi:hypothetical protein
MIHQKRPMPPPDPSVSLASSRSFGFSRMLPLQVTTWAPMQQIERHDVTTCDTSALTVRDMNQHFFEELKANVR